MFPQNCISKHCKLRIRDGPSQPFRRLSFIGYRYKKVKDQSVVGKFSDHREDSKVFARLRPKGIAGYQPCRSRTEPAEKPPPLPKVGYGRLSREYSFRFGA